MQNTQFVLMPSMVNKAHRLKEHEFDSAAKLKNFGVCTPVWTSINDADKLKSASLADVVRAMKSGQLQNVLLNQHCMK